MCVRRSIVSFMRLRRRIRHRAARYPLACRRCVPSTSNAESARSARILLSSSLALFLLASIIVARAGVASQRCCGARPRLLPLGLALVFSTNWRPIGPSAGRQRR